ncbi:MAG: rRNA maturation RNase YbeY [Desulfobulbaceae bacterium]|nr:rRNA maturation RNase YbeY [Desulfobulbaceae bacterium]
MSVLLQSEVARLPFEQQELEEAAAKLLRSLQRQDCELSILLVDDAKITKLNDQYRGKKKPTNVLSFPMFDDDDTFPGPPMLGDIVISIDTAAREADSQSIPLIDYLGILLVHGLVHLLGFDHEQGKKEAGRMAAKEKELLHELHGFQKLLPLSK